MVLPKPLNDTLSSAYYALSTTVILIGAIVYIIGLHGAVDRLQIQMNAIDKRIDDIDLHGTRTLPLVEQRLNNLDLRQIEFIKRTGDLEHRQYSHDQALQLLNERQTNLARRLDRLEGQSK